jgi:hypothetical protein
VEAGVAAIVGVRHTPGIMFQYQQRNIPVALLDDAHDGNKTVIIDGDASSGAPPTTASNTDPNHVRALTKPLVL